MHILHVVQLYYPVASGAARYFSEIGERLAREGHRVTVLATDAHDLEHFWRAGQRRVELAEEQHGGVRIVRLPVRRLAGPPILYPLLRRAMVELSHLPSSAPLLRRLARLTPRLAGLASCLDSLAAEGVDLVHATNITLDFAVLPALDFAQRRGVPFLCTPFVHLGAPGDQRIVRYYSMRHQLELLRASTRVITMTGLERDFLAARGVSPEQLRRVGVGVSPAEVQGGDGARFRAEHAVDGAMVLCVGAMAYDKGTIHVVEAMQRLWANGSDATLVLIGAPLAHFSEFYARLPAADRARIKLLPYAPDSVKYDALAAADLLVMPSRTDSFGIVYLEAWCYRLPVIGARAGGVPDVVADGQDGILVPFGDVAALASAIGRLLSDRALARRLGLAGHAKVMEELTWDTIYAKARAVYAEVLPL